MWATGLSVKVDIQDEEKYPGLAGTYVQSQFGPILGQIAGLVDRSEAGIRDTGFIYTTQVDVHEDGQIQETFNIGSDQDPNHAVLHGWALFKYDGEGIEGDREAGIPAGTGYSIATDFFCIGEFAYCEENAA